MEACLGCGDFFGRFLFLTAVSVAGVPTEEPGGTNEAEAGKEDSPPSGM